MNKKFVNIFLFSLLITISLLSAIWVQAANDYTISDIALTPGRTPSELNFAWYTTEDPAASVVQIAPKSEQTDASFPEEKAAVFTGTAAPATTGLASNKVTVSNLKNETEYIYRLGDGTPAHWSPIYQYTTQNPQDFGFIFVGDPQIGYSSTTQEAQVWNDTLAKALNKFPNTSFLLSAGDQVQSNKIALYNAFFSPQILRSLPVAAVQGNHEAGAEHFSLHFHQPNLTQHGKTSGGGEDGGYYFSYGNTLFMCLNTNNQYSAEHNALMREAVAAYPNAKWKVLMFHHSIYSTAGHHQSTYVQRFINGMCPVIDELGIDLVLMGHDHVYVRTFQMKGNEPQTEQTIDEKGRIVNPTGTLYLTGNSSTGSKYYDIEVANPAFAAVNNQLQVPSFSYIRLNGQQLSIETYRTDTMEIYDQYTIAKHHPVVNAPGLSLESFTFMKDNAAIQALDPKNAGGSVYGSVTLSNSADTVQNFTLLMAKYNEKDQLIDQYIAEETIMPAYTEKDEGSITQTIDTPSIDGSSLQPGEYLKLFLWKNQNGTPYTPAKTLRIEEALPPEDPNTYRLECENLVTTSAGAEELDFNDPLLSKGSGNLLRAQAVGDYVEYAVEIPSSGAWEISLITKTDIDGGKFRLYLPQSEKYVGTEESDQYAPNSAMKTLRLGKYSFNSAGTKQFRLVITGKHPDSNGYFLRNDAIVLTKL